MFQTIKRIRLPSGGWWEIETRPRWKHVRRWADDIDRPDRSLDLVERALVSLTTAWSFCDAIGLESLARRDARDLITVLEAFQCDVVLPLEEDTPVIMAEELFAGMVGGRIPPRFAEAHLMAATGWSWQTLQETPADVVQTMAIYLAVRQTRETKAVLEFHDTEEG